MKLEEEIRKRITECKVESCALKIWLGALGPANVVLVGGGGVLSLLAGASVLVDTGLVETHTAGLMALTSGVFTFIHNRFRCDPHQAECHRLSASLDGFASKYRSLLVSNDEVKQRQKLMELDAQKAAVQEGADASAPSWCIRRAAKQVKAQLAV